MKKIIYSILSIFVLTFAACTDEGMEFDTNGGNGLEFLHFATSGSYLIESDTENIEVVIGITSKSDAARTFNISVDTEKSTAVEGVDFNLPLKTVTIPAGQYLGTVEIEPLYDTMTQDGSVSVVLKLDTDLLSPAYGNSTTLNLTYAFTVDMDYLVGTWTESDYADGGALQGSNDVTITKKSETEIYINNFWDGGETIVANVDFDAMTITIPAGQVVYYYDGYGDCFLVRYSTAVDSTADITGTLSALGIRIDNWASWLQVINYTWAYSYAFLEKKN